MFNLDLLFLLLNNAILLRCICLKYWAKNNTIWKDQHWMEWRINNSKIIILHFFANCAWPCLFLYIVLSYGTKLIAWCPLANLCSKKFWKKGWTFTKKKLWKLEGKIQISSFSCSNLYRKVLLLIFSFFYLYYYDIFQIINRFLITACCYTIKHTKRH